MSTQDQRDEIDELLNSIVWRGPPKMPDRERYISTVNTYGRKKLRETLIREADHRFAAEATLLKEGFRQSRDGVWEKT